MEKLLGKEIKKRRQEAHELLEKIVPILVELGVREEDISYRIKSEKSIREKIARRMTEGKHEGKTPIEVLDTCTDIAAITIAAPDLEQAAELAVTLPEILLQEHGMKMRVGINHFDNPTPTGYKTLTAILKGETEMPFEIQFTDRENLKKRNETHAEYRAIKYGNLAGVPLNERGRNVMA